jgi:AAA+ ATPase superfamily predicted ATPase
VDAGTARSHVEEFIDSSAPKHTLGLLYGRRRIGKSTLLEGVCEGRGGFYWEATRTASALQLERFGEALGAHLGVGRLAISTWEQALSALWRLGHGRPAVVVLDEFGHLLESDPSIASVLATMLGPKAQRDHPGSTRLILCGSAIAMMSALTVGEAPLRGRAGMELVMRPADYRLARSWVGDVADRLAVDVHAVIGGVVGYATDMVDHDLPATQADFDRWVCRRVLSPAATLHREALTLLAEDPTLSGGNVVTHHAILAAIATGSVTAGTIAKRMNRSFPAVAPHLTRLIDSGFVTRQEDPIRDKRPLYALADPFLQFHYAVLEPNGPSLRDTDLAGLWAGRLKATFRSAVLGPVVEEQARTWVRRYASAATRGDDARHIGPSSAHYDGADHQLDVLVAGPGDTPAYRTVLAIGEAKAGAQQGLGHLNALEKARSAWKERAAGAKLLLIGPGFEPDLLDVAAARDDVELVDFHRLYTGD